MYSYRDDYCGQKWLLRYIVLTLQEVPLRYYYYCGLPLQYYCDTIVWNIYACLKEEIKIMVGLSVCTGTNSLLNQ